MSRERLHHAINTTDMGWSDLKVKDIDILTALGITDGHGELEELGGLLLVIKTATRSKSIFYIPGNDLYQLAVKNSCEALSEVCRHHRDLRGLRRDERQYLASIAITEWINDACPPCNGTGNMKRDDGTVVITCESCKGGKKRRYGDAERLDALQLGSDKSRASLRARYLAIWERALMILHGVIGLAERAKLRATIDLLERF